jgi:hypothetical protein
MSPSGVVAGLLGGMVLLFGYFVDELVHYRVFRFLEVSVR